MLNFSFLITLRWPVSWQIHTKGFERFVSLLHLTCSKWWTNAWNYYYHSYCTKNKTSLNKSKPLSVSLQKLSFYFSRAEMDYSAHWLLEEVSSCHLSVWGSRMGRFLSIMPHSSWHRRQNSEADGGWATIPTSRSLFHTRTIWQ